MVPASGFTSPGLLDQTLVRLAESEPENVTYKQNMTRAKVIQVTAIAAIGFEKEPRCQGPLTKRSDQINRLAMGIA
jgi:hypothetical protein